jgi:Zn-dependent protease
MELLDTVFLIAVIIMSAVIHEVMHGVVAEWLGDPTARYAGRLTLNPIPHLDAFGSVLLPVFLALTHSPVFFAWAKPVPYNPYNLRPGRFSEPLVAFAGPVSNFIIAITFGVFAHVLPVTSSFVHQAWFALGTGQSVLAIASNPAESLYAVSIMILFINVMLCIFNLIPVPPLDGSKVLPILLPHSLAYAYEQLHRRMEYNPFLGMGLVLLVILFLGGAFGSFVYALARLIAGI